jgi:hypothetical protein
MPPLVTFYTLIAATDPETGQSTFRFGTVTTPSLQSAMLSVVSGDALTQADIQLWLDAYPTAPTVWEDGTIELEGLIFNIHPRLTDYYVARSRQELYILLGFALVAAWENT